MIFDDMIKQKYIIAVGILVALVIIGMQIYIINNFGSSTSSNKPEHIELAELMFHNQRFMDKLYFSGMNENWEAAAFYHHEMEENMEVLVEGNIIEDSINISKLAEAIYEPASQTLKNAIKTGNKQEFLEGYQIMVNSCNNCHKASNIDFIKISTPETPAYRNQQY